MTHIENYVIITVPPKCDVSDLRSRSVTSCVFEGTHTLLSKCEVNTFANTVPPCC